MQHYFEEEKISQANENQYLTKFSDTIVLRVFTNAS